MREPQNGVDTDQPLQTQPTVTAVWASPLSADVEVRIENCTPAQLWAAARIIEHYADDLYRGTQIESAMQQQEASKIARELTAGIVPGKIVPVRGRIVGKDS